MNPRDETDLDGDERLINAFRELLQGTTFSIGDEIAKVNELLAKEDRNGQE